MRSGGLRLGCSNRGRIGSFLPFLLHWHQRLRILLILVPLFNLELLSLLGNNLFILSYIKFEFRNILGHLIIRSRTLYFFFLWLLHLQLLIYPSRQIMRHLHFFCYNPRWKLKLLQLYLFYYWWFFTWRSRSILL